MESEKHICIQIERREAPLSHIATLTTTFSVTRKLTLCCTGPPNVAQSLYVTGIIVVTPAGRRLNMGGEKRRDEEATCMISFPDHSGVSRETGNEIKKLTLV